MYANIRDTLKETVDDISKYSGFIDKETRRKMKEETSKSGTRAAMTTPTTGLQYGDSK
ncbi:8952_t:CDS:2, partial [Gigaspora rosea]